MHRFIYGCTVLFFNACSGGSGETASTSSSISELFPGTTWQWQLSGTLNTTYNVKLYDIDLFDTAATEIDHLKKSGRTVICYFSAGSYEVWRDDAPTFSQEAVGNTLDGWEDERWLDIRNGTIRSIMQARLDLAKDKGCDGVEPDNVDGYSNDTGFPLTAEDQLSYNRFLADEAHARGLLIGLKNDLDQIEVLEEKFDFAVNEQCHEYDECDLLFPFLEAGKPVFNAEYASEYVENTDGERDALCENAQRTGLRTLVLPLNLDDSFRYSCDQVQ